MNKVVDKDIEDSALLLSAKLKRSWGWLLLLGIIFVLLGMLGLSMTVGITVFSMYFFAILLFVAGFSQLADAWHSSDWHGIVWHGLIAVLYMLAAAMISYDPLLASTLITAAIAWIFIFMGVSRLFMFFYLYKAPGCAWLLISSLFAIALGVLILVQWPLSGIWFIGTLIAIELIISGWTYIFIAIALRNQR